jgi:hypothetical protein
MSNLSTSLARHDFPSSDNLMHYLIYPELSLYIRLDKVFLQSELDVFWIRTRIDWVEEKKLFYTLEGISNKFTFGPHGTHPSRL